MSKVDEENTLRTLKDQTLLVSSPWCAFGIHQWEQWGKAFKPMEKTSNRYVQTRHCARCNKMDVSEVNLPRWIGE